MFFRLLSWQAGLGNDHSTTAAAATNVTDTLVHLIITPCIKKRHWCSTL